METGVVTPMTLLLLGGLADFGTLLVLISLPQVQALVSSAMLAAVKILAIAGLVLKMLCRRSQRPRHRREPYKVTMVLVGALLLSSMHAIYFIFLFVKTNMLMFVLPTLTCIFNASALFVFGVVVDQLFPSLGTLAAPTPPVEKGRNKDFKPIECTYRRFEGQLGGDDVDGTCSICLEEFQSQDLLAELPCRHVFHAPCAHQWMYSSTISSRTVCPMRCKVHAKNQEKQRWPTDTYYV
eukprot:TRINITY_DN58819_c0_g1_i2.p1 TRINITY_DN58819_c0_g1~~TRINITY_DN58819_c0_g1_i2.p1  ORF type:complete len:275 (-),score=44.31 TRINITY_DN58819_c0_g1_i2:46-759(-)